MKKIKFIKRLPSDLEGVKPVSRREMWQLTLGIGFWVIIWIIGIIFMIYILGE